MAKSIPIFRGSTGLNNKVDPARLRFDAETGIQELAESVNVDIDSTGRISRRMGYTRVRTDVVHSLWSDGNACYYVSGSSLYRLNSDWTRTGLRSGLTPNAPMSFCNPDGGSKVYYANGFENGVIEADVSSAWIGQAYPGPTTIWKISTTPPVGDLLESMGGYLLIAQDDVLWISVQFAYSWFRTSRDQFPMDGPITMMKAADDGLWISDNRATYWLEGLDPSQWRRHKRAEYPAVAGSASYFDGALLESDNLLPGRYVIWTTPKNGICIGGPQGYFSNLTHKKLVYPECQSGAGIVIDDRYVCAMDGNLSGKRLGLAMNIPAMALSQYLDFTFNSMSTFQGVPLAGGPGGIFRLDSGKTDNGLPIEAWAKFPTSDYGSSNIKRMRKVSVGYEANGALVLTLCADEKRSRDFSLPVSNRDQSQNGHSVAASRDLYGRYWSIAIRNTGGCDFSLDSISITPNILNRSK